MTTTPSSGNQTGALGLVLATAAAWLCSRFQLYDAAQSFSTPMGSLSLSGGEAQVLTIAGAFVAPQLLASLARVPVISQVVSLFTQPSATSVQLSSLTTTVNGIDQRMQAIANSLKVPS